LPLSNQEIGCVKKKEYILRLVHVEEKN